MDELLEIALNKSIALLEEHGYRYAVVGGLAVQVWGPIRVTRDVDLMVLIPRGKIEIEFTSKSRDPSVSSRNLTGLFFSSLLCHSC